MEKELVHDPIFLSLPSAEATEEDRSVGQDLIDTLTAHREECVGMAANMIGVRKRILVYTDGEKICLMYNPRILRQENPYGTEESCLSLQGGPRKTIRYRTVKIEYCNESFQKRIKTFSGFTAQIIQHEMDHCNGVLI